MFRDPRWSTLFPYTTLFRSSLIFTYPTPVLAPGTEFSIEARVITEGLEQYPTKSELKMKMKDRKSTRLNSSHSQISYAVFCLKKKYGILIPLLSYYAREFST